MTSVTSRQTTNADIYRDVDAVLRIAGVEEIPRHKVIRHMDAEKAKYPASRLWPLVKKHGEDRLTHIIGGTVIGFALIVACLHLYLPLNEFLQSSFYGVVFTKSMVALLIVVVLGAIYVTSHEIKGPADWKSTDLDVVQYHLLPEFIGERIQRAAAVRPTVSVVLRELVQEKVKLDPVVDLYFPECDRLVCIGAYDEDGNEIKL